MPSQMHYMLFIALINALYSIVLLLSMHFCGISASISAVHLIALTNPLWGCIVKYNYERVVIHNGNA